MPRLIKGNFQNKNLQNPSTSTNSTNTGSIKSKSNLKRSLKNNFFLEADIIHSIKTFSPAVRYNFFLFCCLRFSFLLPEALEGNKKEKRFSLPSGLDKTFSIPDYYSIGSRSEQSFLAPASNCHSAEVGISCAAGSRLTQLSHHN